MKTILQAIKRSAAPLMLLALVASPFGLSSYQPAKAVHAAGAWDTTGNYTIDMNHLGTDHTHDMSLSQDSSGNLTGNGGSPAGANVYTWEIISGSVTGDMIEFDANYTATADAVTPQTVLHIEGTIAEDGTLHGTWSDNYQGGEREGTWTSTSGTATAVDNEEENLRPVISGITAPTVLEVNEEGTFEIKASDRENGSLSYSVKWGDENMPSSVLSSESFVQTSTFTHAYREAGTYTVEFTVKDEHGLSATASVTVQVLENGDENGDNGNVTVTIVKYVDGELATANGTDSYSFGMTSSWDAENIGSGSGSFALSPSGFNNDNAYHATTAEMSSGADYSASEVMSAEVGGSCDVDGVKYKLQGYSVGHTLESAENAPKSSSASLSNITHDKYIIVWNDDCATEDDDGTSGEIDGDVEGGSGTGTLAVTDVETTDSSGIADGTFENGWEFVFHITVPTDETDLAMKFADWVRTGGGGTIPAANNMRISSPQADNSGATVLITGADTYSSPALNMTGDLDPSMDGKQVKVTVEVKIPSGTTNGSYATTYGVKTE